MDIEKLLAANPAMTDIHLTEGLPLMIRVYGALKKMKEIAEPQLFAELISSYVPPDRQAAYQRTGSADSAFSLGNVRCRLHLYRSGGLASAAIRILPELSLLGADPDRTWLEKVSQLSHGLVLITGSSGSGKSTTMARILSLISQKRACHVVTLEDPVEYVIPMEKALIHQREIGRDVADFPQGIRDALREDARQRDDLCGADGGGDGASGAGDAAHDAREGCACPHHSCVSRRSAGGDPGASRGESRDGLFSDALSQRQGDMAPA